MPSRSVFENLYILYQSHGVSVASGLNPLLTGDYFASSFTHLVEDGESITDGLGISPIEVFFLECLGKARSAEKIFVIGNAYGWSTFALHFSNPGSEVVAIDAATDANTQKGILFTNTVATKENFKIRAILGSSPDDVSSIVEETLGEIDLVFVDGFHSPDQIVKDWKAVMPFLSPKSVVVFHDVLYCELEQGFETIVSESGWQGTILHSTTTGMGILVREPDPDLTNLIEAFASNPSAREVVKTKAETEEVVGSQAQRQAALAYIKEISGNLSHS